MPPEFQNSMLSVLAGKIRRGRRDFRRVSNMKTDVE